MNITTISYSQSKESINPYGLKRWDKCGIEIELSDTDKVENAFELAKGIVNEQLLQHQEQSEINADSTLDTVDGIIVELMVVKDLKTLETYRHVVCNNERLKAAYDLKHKQLSNG